MYFKVNNDQKRLLKPLLSKYTMSPLCTLNTSIFIWLLEWKCFKNNVLRLLILIYLSIVITIYLSIVIAIYLSIVIAIYISIVIAIYLIIVIACDYFWCHLNVRPLLVVVQTSYDNFLPRLLHPVGHCEATQQARLQSERRENQRGNPRISSWITQCCFR